MYETGLLVGLIAAIALNLYTPRSLGLCFVTFWYLLLVPRLMLSFIDWDYWYFVAIVLEIIFALSALGIKAHASRIIAAFSLYNVCCHLGGWTTMLLESNLYQYYSFWLRLGESCQVLALILASRPITQWIIHEHLSCFKKKDNLNGYRLAGLWG